MQKYNEASKKQKIFVILNLILIVIQKEYSEEEKAIFESGILMNL